MVLVAALLLAGCSSNGDTPGADTPGSDALAGVDFPVFAPVLDGDGAESSTVSPDWVSSDYGDGRTLVQLAEPGEDLCAALADVRLAGDTCEADRDVVTTSMEEVGGVGIVRDGTLLYWSGLVTEADPELVDRAAQALREAPAASGDDLGDVAATTTPAAPEQEPTQTEAPLEDPVDEALAPDDLDVSTAVATVRFLAGRVGPREATSAAHDRAARWVARRFTRLGYDADLRPVDVPGGVSWLGDAVPAGRSVNVVATPPGFDATEPHLVVGAHLDTVAQAPGAEDNASGVGVLLATAEAAAVRSTRLPVVFVAFGAEEPRGPGDDDHHFGSRTYVAALGPAERRAVRAMVSLDRVGVGAQVPVGSADDSDPVQRSLLAAGRRAGVATIADPDQRSSDHWSFVRAGLAGARLGSTSYAAYHDASDVPSVVSPAQLERTGRLLLEWLAPR